MQLKKLSISIFKVLISAILAFSILTVFGLVYYHYPNYSEATDGATVFSWEPNSVYLVGTEGYGYGKTNNEGYLNLYDYEEEMPIDILIMGSSHTEAYQVGIKDSFSSRLDSMLKDSNVYNIGISSHRFLVCANNLHAAVQKYRPSKYIVIETWTTYFSDNDLKSTIAGEYKIPEVTYNSDGIMGIIERNRFYKLLASQGTEYLDDSKLLDLLSQSTDDKIDISEMTKTYNDPELVDTLLFNMSETAKLSGAEIIIVYHPSVALQKDGSLKVITEDHSTDAFSALCADNGITFLDMSERFLEEYEKNHTLPYGFKNSSVGNGHFNKYGHAMIADELYKVIEGLK